MSAQAQQVAAESCAAAAVNKSHDVDAAPACQVGDLAGTSANSCMRCCRTHCRSTACAGPWHLPCKGPAMHQQRPPADQSCLRTSVGLALLHSTGVSPASCGLRQADGSTLLSGRCHPCLSHSAAGRLLRCSCTCMSNRRAHCCLSGFGLGTAVTLHKVYESSNCLC